jgi:hypothetical protein
MPTRTDFVTVENTQEIDGNWDRGPQEVPRRQSIVLQVTQMRPAMRHLRASPPYPF